MCLPGPSYFSIVQFKAVYRVRLPGCALMLDPSSYRVLVYRRVHLRSVVVTGRPVARFAAVVTVTIIHCTVVIIKSCAKTQPTVDGN